MATEATVQVLNTAVDAAGVSVVSSTRTAANPRWGTIYNPTTFAAGVPVWFHRLEDGRYLGLFKKRWTAATAVYHNGPQMFSAHTETDVPCWAFIDPTTGVITGPYPIPSNQPGVDTINAAVSRGDYLFTLGTKDGVAWLQHFVITRNGGLQLQGEESVPLGYKLGLYADPFHLWVLGANTGGHLARIRKNWGRIGINSDPQMQWQYEGPKGWYADPAEGASMVAQVGGTIPAAGPVTVAKFRDRYYLTAVEHVAGAYAARVFTTRPVENNWKQVGTDVIYLGEDALYLGGTAYLQPQLVPNSALLTPGVNTGFPYVTSVKVVIGSDQAILTTWGLFEV